MQSLAYCEANVNQYNENSPVISNNLTKYLINDQMSMRLAMPHETLPCLEGSAYLAPATGVRLLQGTLLSGFKPIHSSAFRYILCLTRSFLRFLRSVVCVGRCGLVLRLSLYTRKVTLSSKCALRYGNVTPKNLTWPCITEIILSISLKRPTSVPNP